MTDEISEDDKLGKIKEALKAIQTGIKKIGIVKIALLIVLLLVVGWFLNLPKSGSLNLTVSELDGTNKVEGVYVTLKWPDGQELGDAFSGSTDAKGEVSFTNVPTERDLNIELDASQAVGRFESSSESVKLKSGQTQTKKIYLAKDLKLTLAQSTITGTASESCIKDATATVSNGGDSDAQVTFIGEGDLANAITTSSSQLITVSPGASENATISIDVSKTGKKKTQTITGDARIKGTQQTIGITLAVTEAPKITITPDSLTCSGVNAVCPKIITIKNTGQTTLTNLKIELSQGLDEAIDSGHIDTYFTTNSIAPDGEAKFGVKLLSSTPKIGVITVKADCFLKQINVQTG